jgi:hypothetical protein
MAEEDVAAYLRAELERRRAVLFTGAGFSVDALDHGGRPIPSGPELADELWSMCFPGEARDGSALTDLYQHALAERPEALTSLVRQRLCVDPARLPEMYRLWFCLPWRRMYTLNVDDLESAATARWRLPRRIVVVSALADGAQGPAADPGDDVLEVVHLNGHVEHAPRGMTFSTMQYGARLAAEDDPAYARLVADFYEVPFVFVGSRLDESPLWQHLERQEGTGGVEPDRPRPRSFLVTPEIERARQSLLSRLGITWLPMSTRQFTGEVLATFRDLCPPVPQPT